MTTVNYESDIIAWAGEQARLVSSRNVVALPRPFAKLSSLVPDRLAAYAPPLAIKTLVFNAGFQNFFK